MVLAQPRSAFNFIPLRLLAHATPLSRALLCWLRYGCNAPEERICLCGRGRGRSECVGRGVGAEHGGPVARVLKAEELAEGAGAEERLGLLRVLEDLAREKGLEDLAVVDLLLNAIRRDEPARVSPTPRLRPRRTGIRPRPSSAQCGTSARGLAGPSTGSSPGRL